jgi:hypothetical protein
MMRIHTLLAGLALAASAASIAAPATAQNKRWTLSAPPQEWVLIANPRTSFAVNSDSGIANLKLVHSTLVEQTTKFRLDPTQLRLCLAEDAACTRRIDVPAGAVQRLELRTANGSPPEAGSYSGDVYLAADGSTRTESFKLSVLSTSNLARVGGAAAILLGIGLGWFISIFLRNRAVRLQAEMQAARLRKDIERLRPRLEAIAKWHGTSLEFTSARLVALEGKLTSDELQAQGYIPGALADAFSTQTRAAEFQTFIGNTDAALAGIDVLVATMALIARKWPQDPPAKVKVAVEVLDEAAATVESATSAAATAKAVLETLQADDRAAALAGTPGSTPEPSLREVRMHLTATNSWAWALWALLTLVAGIATLIATNYGFGIGMDYIKCFFWGLGIQLAGQQVTAGVVSTSYSMPKLSTAA